MKEVVYTGIDIDEALIKASESLGLTADNIEFEIVSLGSKGLFGIGKKPAKIKVFLKGEKEEHFKKDKGKKADFKKKKKQKPEKKKKNEFKKESKKERESEKVERDFSSEQKVEKAPSTGNAKKIEDFVLFVTKTLDENTVVSSTESENKLTIIIKTENTGKVIGKGGRIINSIEYLATRYARKLYDTRVKVVVQIEGERKAK